MALAGFLVGAGWRPRLVDGEGGLFGAAGVLEFGAEPADDAAAFFVGPLVVEGDEPGEDFFVGEVGGPAVGVGDGGVEVVVDLAEDGDEALLVDVLFLCGERLAGAELFEDVVHAGHRQLRMQLLLTFAMGVELFAELADAGFVAIRWRREMETSEAIALVVV